MSRAACRNCGSETFSIEYTASVYGWMQTHDRLKNVDEPTFWTTAERTSERVYRTDDEGRRLYKCADCGTPHVLTERGVEVAEAGG